MKKATGLYIAMVTSFGILAVVSRLLPHPPNFAPMTALALFAGVIFQRYYWSIVYLIGLMFLSDLLLEVIFGIGFHSGMPVVYGTLLVITLLGRWLRQRFDFLHIAGTTIFGSLVFFVLTNLGVWLWSGMYPHTLSGLLQCFTLALPFFHNAVAGDITYSAIIFGLYSFVVTRSTLLRQSAHTVPALGM